MRSLILLVACFRGARVACHILYGILLACFFPVLSQRIQRYILKNWSCTLLGMMHVQIEAHGCCQPESLHGRILVANHISWLDVIAINAVVPSWFVAKSDIRSWPLLGWLCSRVGTMFIRRGIRSDTARINGKISGMLELGECVAVFPEGTSTDGVLPGHFHASLLQAAIDINSAICPVAIRYHDETGKANGDAAYVGDMTFIQSLWKIMCSPSLCVSLHYLPPLPCNGKNRRLMAAEAQGAIHGALEKFSSDSPIFVLDHTIPAEFEHAELVLQQSLDVAV